MTSIFVLPWCAGEEPLVPYHRQVSLPFFFTFSIASAATYSSKALTFMVLWLLLPAKNGWLPPVIMNLLHRSCTYNLKGVAFDTSPLLVTNTAQKWPLDSPLFTANHQEAADFCWFRRYPLTKPFLLVLIALDLYRWIGDRWILGVFFLTSTAAICRYGRLQGWPWKTCHCCSRLWPRHATYINVLLSLGGVLVVILDNTIFSFSVLRPDHLSGFSSSLVQSTFSCFAWFPTC